MSVAPHAGIVDFGTFTSPTSSVDGIQGEVPQPLAGQQNYVLTANGWVALSSLGTLVFQGTWDASTNNPTLTSSVGVQGYYYVVSVAGNTNLNGITTWTVGDWAIFSGSVWQKIEGGSTVDITGGTINGTVIGNTNPAAGTFTTVGIDTSGTDAQIAPNTGITGWNYSGLSKSISAQESAPAGLFLSPDGLNMFVNGSTGDDVNQYTLSTAFNISTATFVQLFSTAAQDSLPQDVFFKPDGLSMFIVGATNDTVFQYTLTSAFNISTATYASKSFSVTSQETTPTGLWFKPDGTVMYVIGTTSDTVFQYTLGTAWDVSTASYASISFDINSQESTPNQVNLSADGLTMWILGATGDDISQYALGTAFNVSTAVFENSFYIGFQDNNPQGLFIDSTAANRVYIVGTTNDSVFQYNTATNSISAVTDVFNTTSNARVQGNLAVYDNAYIDGTLVAQGGITTNGTGSFNGLSSSGTTTIATSTAAQTSTFGAGATVSGSLKTLNIGTAGVSGSTTAINIGSAVSGATSTTTLNGSVNIASTNITGGTINGTTIGATTPSSVNATTITGQTGVLRGTGQNLLTNTVSLATTWTQTNIAVTGSQTDPFGGSSAFSINTGTNTGQHTFFQSTSYASNTFTLSLYAKAGTANFVGLYSSAQNAGVIFNINTGAFSANINNAPTSSAITAVGSGWYRCSIVITGAQTFSQFFVSEDGTNLNFTGTSKTIFVYGLQLEIGSTLNTYVPTTSAIVYGTPTLSFSGVSTIGLESNGALFVQPAGTGALQAQATTSTTAGGNARGANAVDWQTTRGSAANVASGSQSVVGGGINNTSSNFYSSVLGGANNIASGNASFVGGGNTNTAGARDWSTVVGGYSNTAAGFYNFVGGGFTNSGTASAAVTTQSATMNATTAVTLSGSNANIKVGQLITGTSITTFPNTYVAAISGTSLTLSQAASGSSTSTLSFFTPHGVVVGGGNNQATGAYSAILGGGDAGSSANRNVASGDWSAVGGGWKNTASSNYSFVGGGGANTASTGFGAVICGGGFFGNLATQSAGNTSSGTSSFVGAGFGNTASGGFSSVSGGGSNIANSNFSTIVGGYYGTTRSIAGNMVFSPSNNPIGTSANGTQQTALLILGVQTTDATATALRSDTSAAGTTNQVILPNNSAYFFKGSCIANVTGAANGAAWSFEGAIMRGANAASTVLIDTPSINRVAASAGATTWTIALTADTTNGGLTVTVTGVAATTIRWVAKVETTEVTF